MRQTLRSAKRGDPDVAHEIGDAFEAAWETLSTTRPPLSSQAASDARIHLARVILDLVHQGEREASRLRDRAVEALDSPMRGQSLAPQL